MRMAALALVLASGCALRGPTAPIPPNDRWSRVAAVPPGSVLRIRYKPVGRSRELRVQGRLAAVDQNAIELMTPGGAMPLARPDILRIDELLPGPDGVTNGAIIGAVAGAAYGVIVVREVEDGILGSRVGVALTGAATGALFGALADWMVLRPRARAIYVRPRASP